MGLGFVFLHERPRAGQWVAVAVAACAVLWLTVQAGRVPWIALILAVTFGFYGLLRKVAALGALEGLALETMVLAPVTLAVLGWWALQGQGALVQGDAATLGWLMLAGPVTAIPLLWFAAGARRIPLATMGILQYISPSMQLLLGVWWFGEPFDTGRMLGFGLIWTALLLYSLEGWSHMRRAAKP